MPRNLHQGENTPYHVARLLILIGECGTPQNSQTKLPSIKGRTLLAKLDFFMRYPKYLKKAGSIFGKEFTDSQLGIYSADEVNTVESRMIRYLYGPWDDIYYVALAYMIGKGLIEPIKPSKVDSFKITLYGKTLLHMLKDDKVFDDLFARGKTIYHLFNSYSGSRLKDFIYTYFTDVVNHDIGEVI